MERGITKRPGGRGLAGAADLCVVKGRRLKALLHTCAWAALLFALLPPAPALVLADEADYDLPDGSGLFHPSQVAPDDPEKEAIRGERGALMRAALAKLAPRDRAALLMREWQGLSCEEIGDALGISHGAAKVALFRARERLRAAYLGLGGEPPEDLEQSQGKTDPTRTGGSST